MHSDRRRRLEWMAKNACNIHLALPLFKPSYRPSAHCRTHQHTSQSNYVTRLRHLSVLDRPILPDSAVTSRVRECKVRPNSKSAKWIASSSTQTNAARRVANNVQLSASSRANLHSFGCCCCCCHFSSLYFHSHFVCLTLYMNLNLYYYYSMRSFQRQNTIAELPFCQFDNCTFNSVQLTQRSV